MPAGVGTVLLFTFGGTGERDALVRNSLLQGTVEGGLQDLNHRGHYNTNTHLQTSIH